MPYIIPIEHLNAHGAPLKITWFAGYLVWPRDWDYFFIDQNSHSLNFQLSLTIAVEVISHYLSCTGRTIEIMAINSLKVDLSGGGVWTRTDVDSSTKNYDDDKRICYLMFT